LKLRSLSLTQYDSILLIDSDVAVVGDVTPLFSLPVEFAASWDQSRWLGK
jgi:lipopolysaccharide biosynthesis glycosyltransferase